MEWDTVWTGSLPRMLAAFHGEPFSANSTIAGRAQGLRVAYDLLGHELEGAHANYPHKNKVNHSFIEYKDAMYSSTQLMRYSRRLLRRVVEDQRQARSADAVLDARDVVIRGDHGARIARAR
jgi:hypothetical protein